MKSIKRGASGISPDYYRDPKRLRLNIFYYAIVYYYCSVINVISNQVSASIYAESDGIIPK